MNKTAARAGILLFMLAMVALFFILDLDQTLTLENIKASRDRAAAYYELNRLTVILAYMGVYIVMAALSLPGAGILSITGGAILGFWTGTIAVSFASTIGATLACAASRFLFRDWVQGMFRDKLEVINRGMEREGGFYLFALRLSPLFPFFMLNMAMGLTRIPLKQFYWVSQASMLPATMIYVNAGRELGKLETLSGILSPGLIASFTLLGIFPLAARYALNKYRSSRGLAELDAGDGRKTDG